ncbi:SdpI family protein [Salinifilum ghardaiensis]
MAQVFLCAVLVLAGAGLVFVGLRGTRGTLPRNRYAGVRTPEAMRSDQAFALANRAAGPALLAGGGAALLAGAAMPALASVVSVVLVAVLGFGGAFALMTLGGVAGHRAAATLPDPAPAGPCGGCALAGACRGASATPGCGGGICGD